MFIPRNGRKPFSTICRVTDMTDQFDVAVVPATDIGAIENQWRDLESRSEPSFFTSWHWVGTLLATLDRSLAAELLTVRTQGIVVGLAVLVSASQTRHFFVRAATLNLNETGRPEFDCLTIEHNAILADRRHGQSVAMAAMSWLVENRPDWDEFHLGGLCTATAAEYRQIGETLGLGVLLRDRKRADHVDLSTVRAGDKGYIESLSRNTRHQIRRAIRLYEETGPVVLTAASSTDEALAFLEALKNLHQPYWNARGRPGAFANAYFETFHDALIRRSFDSGGIQLVRVAAGEDDIGYIYNFVTGRTVYQYQSGFRYDNDPKLKPGLVSHYLAIMHNLERGADIYDFLAGESQHKKSLGTDTTAMDWIVLQRRRLKFRIENGLRDVKHRLASRKEA